MKYHSADIRLNQTYSIRRDGDEFALAYGLSLKEFRSSCGNDLVVVNPILLQLYTHIRVALNASLTIGSGYRTYPAHISIYKEINDALVAKKKKPIPVPEWSAHLDGMAIDINCGAAQRDQIIELAKALDVGGIGKYSWGVHLDVSDPNRRW